MLAEAVWHLLAEGGIEAASVRGVMAETGLSSGSIRFFFSTQAELHEFAMSSLADRVRERIRRVASERGPAARAVAMVAELLPLRDDTERELGVWLAFVGRSRHDPTLARIVAEQADAVRQFLAGILADLATLGLRDESENPRAEAARINALVDGLTLELLTAPDLLTRDEAGTMIRDALLPGTASHPGADR